MQTIVTISVAVATPILAFVGVLVANYLNRRGARELDVWRRREETMRMLRWAVDLASAPDDVRSEMGATVLINLVRTELIQDPDRKFVESIARAATTLLENVSTEKIHSEAMDNDNIQVEES